MNSGELGFGIILFVEGEQTPYRRNFIPVELNITTYRPDGEADVFYKGYCQLLNCIGPRILVTNNPEANRKKKLTTDWHFLRSTIAVDANWVGGDVLLTTLEDKQSLSLIRWGYRLSYYYRHITTRPEKTVYGLGRDYNGRLFRIALQRDSQPFVISET